MNKNHLISIVVPAHNEEQNVPRMVEAIDAVFSKIKYDYEIIFINDGSTDNTADVMNDLEDTNKHIVALHLSRNFGKEIALTAGLHATKGDAAIMLDADLQHPPKFIPKFIAKWERGADVVVGVRTESGKESWLHHMASVVYYKIMRKLSSVPVVPHSTDYRLIDRQVIDEFNRFTERNRMIRGLIDWLGFKRAYVKFPAAKRELGEASYTTSKLIKLAFTSFVSMSMVPLRITMWLGITIVFFSGPLGFYMLIDKYIYDNHAHFSGPASLSVLILFLIGITLMNIGIVGVYIATIYGEVSNRPLYVLRKRRGKV